MIVSRRVAHDPSVRRALSCAVVAELRSAGLVRDPRPFVGPHPAGERNQKPRVSDEPCATGIGNAFARNQSPYGRIWHKAPPNPR